MPATKVQLTGGQFQDSEGNKLVNGYLKMKLAMDGNISGVGNVASGIEIRIQLDSNGSVVTSPAQLVWGVDQMLPPNNYYRVTGFKANGQPAWGPNNQQVVGSGGTFDVGTWVPNTVLSWFPTLQSLELDTNGVLNVNQSRLNPQDTATVTWTIDNSGNLEATANVSGPAFNQTSPGWMMITDGSNYAFDGSSGGFSALTANLIKWWLIRVFVPTTVNTASFRYISAGSGGVGAIGIYDKTGQTKLASWDNFAFSGGAGPKTISITGGTPVTLQPGIYVVGCGQSTTGATATTQGGYKTQGTSDNTNGWNIVTPRSGTAANPMTGGAMPASLGTLSLSTVLGTSLPCVCLES